MTDKRPFIILGIAAAALLTIFILFGRGDNRHNWSENYEETNKSPYGTYVVFNLLKDYFSNQKFTATPKKIAEVFSSENIEKAGQSANFVFIGEGLFLDTADVDQLLDFVDAGNTAFISSKSIPDDLMYFVYGQECNGNYWYDYDGFRDTFVSLNLNHPELKTASDFGYEYLYKNEPYNYRWQYIDSVYFCYEDYSMVELGTINDENINFAKMNYGKGSFYLHTTPLAFTNINLLDDEGLSYANKIFSHLSDGPIFWDKYSRVQENISRRKNQNNPYNSTAKLNTEGPLSYILKQPALAWAWYLALATGLLYLIFRAKRTQRIIPVMDTNANTSLEFIATIGRLYFLQNDPKKLCLQKMKLFLSYVRERYNIPIKSLDETFISNLSLRSEVPESVISKVVLMHQNIKKSGFVSEKTMIEFHLEMDKFYKNRK